MPQIQAKARKKAEIFASPITTGYYQPGGRISTGNENPSPALPGEGHTTMCFLSADGSLVGRGLLLQGGPRHGIHAARGAGRGERCRAATLVGERLQAVSRHPEGDACAVRGDQGHHAAAVVATLHGHRHAPVGAARGLRGGLGEVRAVAVVALLAVRVAAGLHDLGVPRHEHACRTGDGANERGAGGGGHEVAEQVAEHGGILSRECGGGARCATNTNKIHRISTWARIQARYFRKFCILYTPQMVRPITAYYYRTVTINFQAVR